MARIRQVKRADGTLVAFQERKIADAIARALTDAGTSDRPLAYELAGVVALFLSKTFDDSAPSTSDVRAVLGQVLRETGHEAAARRYERALEERERLEAELTVRYPRGEEEGPLTEDGSEEVAPWSRLRMVAGLVRTREIPESLSEQITTAIEDRLIRCGYRSVTRSFLAEMIDHELIEQGLEGVRERSVVFSMNRADLAKHTASDAEGHTGNLDRAIAGTILRSLALVDLHAPAVVSAHRKSCIFVHGLDDPFKVERLVLPAAALDPAFGDDLSTGLLAIRGHLEALRSHVRGALILPDLLGKMAHLPLAKENPARLAEILLSLLDFRDAFSRPSRPEIHLHFPLGVPEEARGGLGFLRELIRTLGKGSPRWAGISTSFCVPGSGSSTGAGIPVENDLLAAALQLSTEGPGCSLRLARPGDPPLEGGSGDGLVPLRVSLARISLNLPLILAAVTEGGLKAVLAALEAPANAAFQAAKERFWQQREGRPQGLHGVVVRLGGPGRVQVTAEGQEVDLEIWGLPYVLDLLVERGVIEPPKVADAAARIFGYLDYLFGGAWEGIRLRVMLGGVQDRQVRRHLFETTVDQADRYGHEDLARRLRAGPSGRGTLPVVIPLFSERNAPLIRAAFAERLGPGLALSTAALEGHEVTPELLARLRDETRLGLVTLSAAGEGLDTFEVQEILFD